MSHVFELATSGYIHLDCRAAYFEGADIREQVLYFSFALNDEEREELRRALYDIS
jgi:hypothetical protein